MTCQKGTVQILDGRPVGISDAEPAVEIEVGGTRVKTSSFEYDLRGTQYGHNHEP